MSGAASEQYLRSTAYLDSDHPDLIEFAERAVGKRRTPVERAVALYYAVRDGIQYDPYHVDLSAEGMRASTVLKRKFGFCIPKATLLAAAARVLGIPSRLGFADVKNHLATQKLLRLMKTDLFVYHGYAELLLEGTWVKATPAFNRTLCERFAVEPLEFDGHSDSLFQQFNAKGDRYMEYVRDRGQFADLPHDEIVAAFHAYYPALASERGYPVSGGLEEEEGGGGERERLIGG